MDKEYWLHTWQSNDIAFHEQNITADLITYIKELNLHPGDSILVPLCGKSRDMLWLAEQGFHVVGIELSSIACSDFFTELNITPQTTKHDKFTKYQFKSIEIICGDFFDLSSTDLPSIKAVYDSKALIALPPDLRQKYIHHFVSCLGTNIRFLLLTRESHCKVNPPPFPIDQNEVHTLYGSYFNIKKLKHQPLTQIPERLIQKGYTEITDGVYLISEKS